MIRETIVMDLMAPRTTAQPPIPTQVELRYDTQDPYAVTMSFRTGRNGAVDWVMGRELVRCGLYGATGDGDIRLHQADDDDHVEIVVRSPTGYARFHALRLELEAFLDLTEQECPAGAEVYDVDALLAQLLGTSS